MKWNDKIRMVLDFTTGLKFLHFKEIIHRLALKDILVNNGKLIIADFGLSNKLAEILPIKKITIKKNQLKVRTSKVLSEADKIAARLAAARSIKSSTQRNVGMTNQNQDRY
ncbi:hypothetical protein RhiirA5_408279 [Rhizophagus irregularis]|uniref:Uncharacterized protein n=1 Tax=Rhizophagus irregularis TaxID=588596 RepID=A0A2I1ERQ6_9GLOM|nr:hypothetical protein RhiirA5_408279 [Rhizophagus irregularis]PKY24806.1 hypothetical protein RhiirB3_439503 [Rhizophagus irregularis]